jgi:hypothetical protein
MRCTQLEKLLYLDQQDYQPQLSFLDRIITARKKEKIELTNTIFDKLKKNTIFAPQNFHINFHELY